MIAKRSPQMKKAVGVLMELSEDDATRMLAEKREWARRDQAALVDDARTEGIAEGIDIGVAQGENAKAEAIAKNLLKTGMSVTETSKITGLSVGEIEALRQPQGQCDSPSAN